VTFLYRIYLGLYGIFDRIIYTLDHSASNSSGIPRWLMTTISTFGLGFQLLIMSIMLILNLEGYVIPFFIGYSSLILIFIGLRRFVLN